MPTYASASLLLCAAAFAGPARADPADDALADRVLAALVACGPLSTVTAPLDWNMAMLGDLGCTIEVPPGWRVQRAPGLLSATSDATDTWGYLWLGGYVPGLQWTAASLSEHTIGQLRQQNPDLRAIRTWDERDPYGLGIQTRNTLVRFTRGGVPEVGNVRVILTGCSAILGNCAHATTMTWLPEARVGRDTCALAQMDATVRCPQGGTGGCWDDDCRQECARQGHRDGACSDGLCRCRD